MRKIVLLCNAGMSTSLLVNKMRKAAEEINYHCTIEAYPVNEVEERAKDADIVLLGPQVRFEEKRIQSKLDCPVRVIDMSAYGMVNGKKVLETAKKELGD
ncbi:PTS sugar transporter subunit IIB [Caldifermentibacillus hisashii]|jgi:PTS system cellobiose-specific IIB component|uniref:PTS sugar transporter subunit IIB n=1 Tax=Caldifermentibacillus hisashii TaxID=996558 RepID=UPI000BA2CED5|nr:PTS sugar transporter subunit IIB [Caldifermentibacillus hisashii]PAC34745.1 PTS sugar transporter subunit IIB [Caldifermentibacillus hisashii]